MLDQAISACGELDLKLNNIFNIEAEKIWQILDQALQDFLDLKEELDKIRLAEHYSEDQIKTILLKCLERSIGITSNIKFSTWQWGGLGATANDCLGLNHRLFNALISIRKNGP